MVQVVRGVAVREAPVDVDRVVRRQEARGDVRRVLSKERVREIPDPLQPLAA